MHFKDLVFGPPNFQTWRRLELKAISPSGFRFGFGSGFFPNVIYVSAYFLNESTKFQVWTYCYAKTSLSEKSLLPLKTLLTMKTLLYGTCKYTDNYCSLNRGYHYRMHILKIRSLSILKMPIVCVENGFSEAFPVFYVCNFSNSMEKYKY